jgi:hypothetical protein
MALWPSPFLLVCDFLVKWFGHHFKNYPCLNTPFQVYLINKNVN